MFAPFSHQIAQVCKSMQNCMNGNSILQQPKSKSEFCRLFFKEFDNIDAKITIFSGILKHLRKNPRMFLKIVRKSVSQSRQFWCSICYYAKPSPIWRWSHPRTDARGLRHPAFPPTRAGARSYLWARHTPARSPHSWHLNLEHRLQINTPVEVRERNNAQALFFSKRYFVCKKEACNK